MTKFIKIDQPINRLHFLYAFLCMLGLGCMLFLIRNNYLFVEGDNSYFRYILICNFITILVFTPFVIRRLLDIGLSKYLFIFFWLGVLADVPGILFLKTEFNIEINPFNPIILLIEITVFILLLILLFKRGNQYSPNKELNLDSGADVPPPVN